MAGRPVRDCKGVAEETALESLIKYHPGGHGPDGYTLGVELGLLFGGQLMI